MASLGVLIRMVDGAQTAMKESPNQKSLWEKGQILQHLKPISTRHTRQFLEDKSNDRASHDQMGGMYDAIDNALLGISGAVDAFQHSVFDDVKLRDFVVGTYGRVVAALKEFDVVQFHSVPSPLTWRYLKKVYQVAIVLGGLFTPPGEESMLEGAAEFLKDIEGNGFSFKNETSLVWDMLLPTATQRYLFPVHETPTCALPHASNRTPPRRIPNTGPYGPSVFLNRFQPE